jgi:hypothetical protein
MSDAIFQLSHDLALSLRGLTARALGSSAEMKRVAETMVEKFGAGTAPEAGAIEAAVTNFFSTGQIGDFRNLKLICYGMAHQTAVRRERVLDIELLTSKVLTTVAAFQPKVRQFRRCYQGLLSVYLSRHPDKDSNPHMRGCWEKLREFLRRHISHLGSDSRKPDWAVALADNPELFTTTPCVRFGKAMLEGDKSQFDQVCARLNVGMTAWLREEAVLAAIDTAISPPECAKMKTRLPALVGMLRTAPMVRSKGAARLLNAYANLPEHPQQIDLRNEAFELFGNPLLSANLPRWRDINDNAQGMVADWLKLSVIKQFFELLSHDGMTDPRRVNFWSTYVPIIENIWLLLGPSAQGPDFRKLRELLGDHSLSLTGGSRTNNAFIMKIGQHYVIEFGESGHATYIYNQNSLPFALNGTLHLSADLKQGRTKLEHRDGLQKWEEKFRSGLRLPPPHQVQLGAIQVETRNRPDPRTGVQTPTRVGGVSTPDNFNALFRNFCAERGLRYEDKRHRGGVLIVYADSSHHRISGTLGQWGFRYDAHRECWIKRSI